MKKNKIQRYGKNKYPARLEIWNQIKQKIQNVERT